MSGRRFSELYDARRPRTARLMNRTSGGSQAIVPGFASARPGDPGLLPRTDRSLVRAGGGGRQGEEDVLEARPVRHDALDVDAALRGPGGHLLRRRAGHRRVDADAGAAGEGLDDRAGIADHGCGVWCRGEHDFHRAARLDGAAEGLRGVDRGDPSPMDDGDAVAELVRLLEVVRGEEHRGAALAVEAPDRVPDEAGARDVEAGRRLVEEEDRRLADERHAEHQALAESTGERPAAVLTPLREAQRRDPLRPPPRALRPGDAVQLG